jgi:hydroxymethylbilane synthase
MTRTSLVIATRNSPLALWQAEWVRSRLLEHHPELQITLSGITTSGDQRPPARWTQDSGKSLFVKELESALLAKHADMAVHSMKDVPMVLPSGLCLTTVCEREDPRDAFISNQFKSLGDLPTGARVGTASLRRQSQLYALRPDVQVEDLHGNVHTRLACLDREEFAAIILAAAGLKRLHLQHRIRSWFDIKQSLPAAGQGALGIECREDDAAVQKWVSVLNHTETERCIMAERALCQYLDSGCHVPVAAYAAFNNNGEILLHGLVARPDGQLILRAEGTAMPENAEELGKKVAEHLLQQGAGKILRGYLDEKIKRIDHHGHTP